MRRLDGLRVLKPRMHDDPAHGEAGPEPERAGLHWIASDGTPCQLDMEVGNRFFDPVTGRQSNL